MSIPSIGAGSAGGASAVASTPPPSTPPVGSRPDLDNVLRDYQVEDDATTTWSPSALGFIPVPFTGEYNLTETEAELLDNLSVHRGLLGLDRFNDIKDEAFGESENRFPDPASIPSHVPSGREAEWIGNDGQRDAFRHAYWNAMLTSEFGAEWTAQFATAHEALPGNPATREAMDLYNNEVGRQIALDNPDATDQELADLVMDAVHDGRLVVIDQKGDLAWSDNVTLWDHGLTDGVPGVGGQPVPDGSASAE